jgi:hypothetical protein
LVALVAAGILMTLTGRPRLSAAESGNP